MERRGSKWEDQLEGLDSNLGKKGEAHEKDGIGDGPEITDLRQTLFFQV